jgi:hypothetical protein
MKTATSWFAALLLTGSLVATGTAKAFDGVISRDEFTAGGYCHMRFPALERKALSSNDPLIKSFDSGDVIDFYGRCDEQPIGKDEADKQKQELQHRWANNYED